MMREPTLNHVKCVSPLKMSLVSFLILFGMYSVSLEAHSYPVSRNNYSTSFESTSSQSVKLTRSARDNPPVKEIQTQPPFSPGTHNLSLGVGQVFLLGRLGNNHSDALGLQLHYNYGVSELFAFEANFGHSSHSNSSLGLNFLSAGLRTNLIYFDQLVPFFNLGLGFYRPSEKFGAVELSSVLFGLQLGGGVDLLITNQVFFGSRLTYHNMFTSSKTGSDGVSREIGGAFASFLIHVGYNF